MSNGFAKKIAKKYVQSTRLNKGMSSMYCLSIIGIAIGVATLIIVMSVMNGFRLELMKSILGFNGHVHIYPYGEAIINNQEKIVDSLKQNPQISNITPLLEKQIIINSTLGAMVYGISLQDLKKRKYILSKTVGNINPWNANNILIGSKMALKLGVGIGDNISLMSDRKNHTAFGVIPALRNFKIIGIFNLGMKEYDTNVAFIPFSVAEDFFNYKGANHIEVFLRHYDAMQLFYKNLEKKLYENVKILNWQQIHGQFFHALKVEKNVMFLILP